MTINSRTKGANAERYIILQLNAIVANINQKQIIDTTTKIQDYYAKSDNAKLNEIKHFKRNPLQYSEHNLSDITNPFNLAIEVKHRNNYSINKPIYFSDSKNRKNNKLPAQNIHTWWKHLVTYSIELIPILIFRADYQPWQVMMFSEHLSFYYFYNPPMTVSYTTPPPSPPHLWQDLNIPAIVSFHEFISWLIKYLTPLV